MNWIKNAIFALGVAGLYSIILVILRVPSLSQYFADPSIFKSALIIHVNLSVLVWLLAITCFFWDLNEIRFSYNYWYSLLVSGAILLMSISPILAKSDAVMNNYVPILENIIFILGLSLFLCVILCFAVQTIILVFFKNTPYFYGERVIAIVQFTTAIMFLLVCVCFILSYMQLDELSNIVPLDLDYYYEMLFWSGGHLLQFIYTQTMMLAFMILVESYKKIELKYVNMYEMILWLNFTLACVIIIGHVYLEVSDNLFKHFFTYHMIYTGGIAPLLMILVLLIEILQNYRKDVNVVARASFICASALFLFGGGMGAMISGINVTIPAHYHGSIVGITIAFMGVVYLVCFKDGQEADNSVINYIHTSLNIAKSAMPERAKTQIYLISSGQLIHIIGLFLAGGYGVMRKTTGQEIALSAKFYMGMVGIGGSFAIIGGLMFVYICAKKLLIFNDQSEK